MRMASEEQPSPGRTCFHARLAPKVDIEFYLSRIRKHIPCSDACFVLALIYIGRVTESNTGIVVNELTCHRLFLTAIMLATRFHDDEEVEHYSNAFFAKLGGIGVEELRTLEIRFLQMIDWKLYVSIEEFSVYRRFACGGALACSPAHS